MLCCDVLHVRELFKKKSNEFQTPSEKGGGGGVRAKSEPLFRNFKDHWEKNFKLKTTSQILNRSEIDGRGGGLETSDPV